MKEFELGNSSKSILGLKTIENNYDFDHEKYVYDENRINDAHTSVIKLVSPNTFVLDIGCASGIIGSVLNKYKNCTVDGIEYDTKAYEVAKKYGFYNKVMNFSIVDVDSNKYKKFFNSGVKYDYIIFADVLEHLVDPYNAIFNVSSLLKENGKIIVSIPNICHIDIIKGLFEGNFNYSRYGILDSTHLRFFSSDSFVQMINNINKRENTNFKVELVDQVKIKPDYFDNLELNKLGLNDNYLDQLLVLQNIFTISVDNKIKVNKYKLDYSIDFCDYIINKVKSIESDKSQIVKYKAELTEANNRMLMYEKSLSQIYNSFSWKITKPFRFIARVLFRKDK